MSGNWRPLPDSLNPETAYLVGQLRDLKDRSGLSLAALAAKTAYSKSSWERYLNGRALPPRHAVETLARLAGDPVGRLLALWEQAEAQWSGRAAEHPATAAQPVPADGADATDRDTGGPAAHRRLPGWAYPVLGVCAAAAVFAAVAGPLGVLGTATPEPGAAPSIYTVGCRGALCAGQDAEGMACGVDAADFADLHVGRTYLELRISDQCEAAWSRVSHSAVGDRVEVTDKEGHTQVGTALDAAATTGYVGTPMIAARRHDQVRACLLRGHSRPRCTTWGADHRPAPPDTEGGAR
jgi:transcriptional regulator with XRE-family HTH domain